MSPTILIVGAGPSGLIAALTLNRFNIPFKIIEKRKRSVNRIACYAVGPWNT